MEVYIESFLKKVRYLLRNKYRTKGHDDAKDK